MARGELLSVLGLYEIDESIFNELVIPNEINKETLINNILLDCAELEVLYPNPNVLKSAIGFWSKSRLKAWEDMKNVLIVDDYRPFINLERKESGYDLETRDLNSKSNANENASGNVLNKISAFNSSNLENKDSSDTSSNSSTTSNIDDTGTIRKDYEHTFEGDSAMFTKQNIVEQEMEMRLKYDLYKIIIEEFKKKFCLLIY